MGIPPAYPRSVVDWVKLCWFTLNFISTEGKRRRSRLDFFTRNWSSESVGGIRSVMIPIVWSCQNGR